MGSPIPIQLCLQGGAAKIPFLAAFVEAVEELHNDREIRVTNVAGTSAGAIIGTLFAADVPMASVRIRFAQAPMEQIFPSRWWSTIGWKLVNGDPIWDEGELRKFLAGLLDASRLRVANPPKQLATFNDILKHREIRVRIMATNLTDAARDIKESDDFLVNSMLDSAALPFLFRARNSPNGTVVDGGLSENLPSDLLSDDEIDGPIVAVSFARTVGSPPQTMREYFMAVMGAGIDQGVDRARVQLEERAKRAALSHEVYSIPPRVDSFDFEKALRDGLAGEYETLRDNAREWLKGFVDRRRTQMREKEDRKGLAAVAMTQAVNEKEFFEREVPKNLAKMYKTQHEPDKLRWGQTRLMVTASATDDRADAVHHSTEFYTLDKPVWCHRLPILASPQSHVVLRSGWALFDPDKRVVPYYHMLMDADGDPPALALLICFDKPLPPKSGPYSLVLSESVHGFMKKLRNGVRDDLWVSFHRRQGTVDRIEVIAHVPQNLDNIKIEAMAGAASPKHLTDFELKKASQPPNHRSYGMFATEVDLDKWGIYLNPIGSGG